MKFTSRIRTHTSSVTEFIFFFCIDNFFLVLRKSKMRAKEIDQLSIIV